MLVFLYSNHAEKNKTPLKDHDMVLCDLKSYYQKIKSNGTPPISPFETKDLHYTVWDVIHHDL